MAVLCAPTTPSPDEISMWPAEPHSGTLPRVCVKTGQPAARYYTLNFVASDERMSADLRWQWNGAQWISTGL